MNFPLRFIPLGGTEGVNKNMYLYEYKDSILVVECGLGFPSPFQSFLGVERILPDFSYLLQRREKIKGILITHGHEDHFGALPFLLKKVSAPVYSTKLTAGFIQASLEDEGVKKAELRVFDPEFDLLRLGPFTIFPFRITHSVPDSVGFIIKTPVGKFVHLGDFKFDWTPVSQFPFDLKKLLEEGRDPLVLLSDCLGVNNDGYTQSEKTIKSTFRSLLSKAEGQVLITTISSNISRIQQAIDTALEMKRKIVFVGRSLREKVRIAQRLGYLYFPKKEVVLLKKAKRLNQKALVYLVAGSYGQEDSALFRIAEGSHPFVKLEKGALVIFSADPSPPGTKILVDALVDRLIAKGAEVHYYDIQENLHVSGHASRGDLAILIALVRPKFFIPIGGTLRHIRAYKELVGEMNFDSRKVLELTEGQTIEFFPKEVRMGKKIKVSDVFLTKSGRLEKKVLEEREELVRRGLVVVSVFLSQEWEVKVASFGVFGGKRPSVLEKVKQKTKEILQKQRNVGDIFGLKEEIKEGIEDFFLRTLNWKPLVLVIIHP